MRLSNLKLATYWMNDEIKKLGNGLVPHFKRDKTVVLLLKMFMQEF